MKIVSGSTIQTMGAVQAVIYEGSIRIPFTFQLVDKGVDLPCDDILGRDFLAYVGTKICYETQTLKLGTGSTNIHIVFSPIKLRKFNDGISEPMHINKGVRQGCSLSLVLFNIYIKKIIQELKEALK